MKINKQQIRAYVSVQVSGSTSKIRHECETCGLVLHDPDAIHCKHCGATVHIVTEGSV